MPSDRSCPLWQEKERFFHDREVTPIRQQGPHCVSTSLAMLTGEAPEFFQGFINTQNPVSWSEALRPFGMKLAYCPTDVRKLRFYMDELLEVDDLFALCYYTTTDTETILRDPDGSGWICGSHIVLMHGAFVIDPASGTRRYARDHACNDRHTKRVFRLVPAAHHRGL